LRCISTKNAPEIEKICASARISQKDAQKLVTLASLYGKWEDVRETLLSLCTGEKMLSAVLELEAILETVRALGGSDAIYIDFSTVNDMNYYNGIIFQGYVDGLHTCILTGGRYDPLLQQFGRDTGAIGFAVYLDLLEHFQRPEREYDFDVLLLYDETTPPACVAERVRRITESGESVRAAKSLDENLKCRRLVRLEGGREKEAGDA
jgi:ATP phosphoribosyltransferase regulatory subunit